MMPAVPDPVDLDQAQALTDKAQSLPWSMHVSDMDDRFAMIFGTPTVEHVANYVHSRDAEFIVAARSWVPALISELRQAREALTTAAQHPYKGPNDTDASMLLEAAKRIEGGYVAGGQHTRATAGRVLRAVASAIGNQP